MSQVSEKSEVHRTERGWAGHFIGSAHCRFRRNTLLDRGDCQIVVSTIGRYCPSGYDSDEQPLIDDRYYETRAFHADPRNSLYHPPDITHEIPLDAQSYIGYQDADLIADAMHETIVAEVTEKLLEGYYQAVLHPLREIDLKRRSFLRKCNDAKDAWNEAVKVCAGISIDIVREVFREDDSILTYPAMDAIQRRLHEAMDAPQPTFLEDQP